MQTACRKRVDPFLS